MEAIVIPSVILELVSKEIAIQQKLFSLVLLLLSIEIMIALFVHDSFIRPYLGDLLVVMLIYFFIKAFFTTPVVETAIAVLLFACLIEVLQYFNLADKLGLQHSNVARIIIGSSFDWKDIAAYVAGTLLLLAIERKTGHRG